MKLVCNSWKGAHTAASERKGGKDAPRERAGAQLALLQAALRLVRPQVCRAPCWGPAEPDLPKPLCRTEELIQNLAALTRAERPGQENCTVKQEVTFQFCLNSCPK